MFSWIGRIFSKETDNILSSTKPPNGLLIYGRIKVYIYQADVRQLKFDGIICSNDETLSCSTGLAKSIADLASSNYKKQCEGHIMHQQLEPAHVVPVVTDIGVVFNVVVPHLTHGFWKRRKYSEGEYRELLSNAFSSALREAERWPNLYTLVISPLGAGQTSVTKEWIAEAMGQALMYELRRDSQLREIHIVDLKADILNLIASEMSKHKDHFKPINDCKADVDNSEKAMVFSSSYRMKRKSPASQPFESKEMCIICMSDLVNPKQLAKCKHTFCTRCIEESFEKCGPKCPCCGEFYGVLRGNQPKNGTMHVRKERGHLPGYDDCGTIVIDYYIPDGTQGPEHPNPGKYYTGTSRTAYLPDNVEGNKILRLLEKAFDAQLIFTVGRSATTGCDNVVIWNDIHHKTSRYGGQQSYGYPDPTYLKRVEEELAAKGIKCI